MTNIIPDRATAARVGQAAIDAGEAVSFTTFNYEQPRTRLTLYGVSLLLRDGSEREVRFQRTFPAEGPFPYPHRTVAEADANLQGSAANQSRR